MAKNRGYTAKRSQKVKEIRESYEKGTELLPKKISEPRQYRGNIEKYVVFIGDLLQEKYPGIFCHETRAYSAAMEEIREMIEKVQSSDKELTAADEVRK